MSKELENIIQKEFEKFAKELIQKGLDMIYNGDTSERNFAVFHYDYDLELEQYKNLKNYLYAVDGPEYGDFNVKLWQLICKDYRVLECDIGTIEWCTTEIVYTDEALSF